MRNYGQYCPVSMASEALGDRWTLLIVREMIGGATRFNEIERGLPGISRSLLVQRLRQLVRVGIVDAVPTMSGRGNEYHLTPAGKELEPVMMTLGEWAVRWMLAEPRPDEVDSTFTMWWMQRRVHLDRLPAGRTIMRFDLLEDGQRAVFWLVLEPTGVSLCKKDPGLEVDVHLTADALQFQRVFNGLTTIEDAMAAGSVTLHGPARLVRQVPRWFAWSPFRDYVRTHHPATE
jgi:DNA-binding HxlR family transcriptional regulator